MSLEIMEQDREPTDLFGPGEGHLRPDGAAARVAAWFGRRLDAERDRWSLWLAAALGAGVAVYFTLPVEPSTWNGLPLAGPVLLVIAVSAALAGRRHAVTLPAALLALAFALGLTVAQGRALAVAGPVLERPTAAVMVEGKVVFAEPLAAGARIAIEHPTVAGLAAAATPVRVRLRLGSAAGLPEVGTRVAVRAKLMPPPEPAAPGAYDFRRQAWFERLGGVGYAIGPVTTVAAADPSDFHDAVARLRAKVTARLMAVVGGEEGAVAAALVPGEQNAVPPGLLAAYRDSGIAHLLSISGLHMSMVAGLVFVGVRGLLALIPAIALRFPVKKWTAAVALGAAFGYLLLSGASVPSQRSFLMVGLVLVAVLLDRTAISMRTVAWAAVAVLLWQPEAVVGPSFQMSFGAVVALIAAYEVLGRRMRASAGRGMAWKLAAYVGGVAATTLIAGMATAPYAAYHFGRYTSYALVTNMAAIPLTGFIVMPAALVAMVLMPLGLDGPALAVMGWGIAAIDAAARTVAAWPAASVSVPPVPPAALAALTLGALWLCLWRTRWRLAGLAPMAVAVAVPWFGMAPDILVSGDGRLLAVRAPDGRLVLPPGRGGGMVRDTWAVRYGMAGVRRDWPVTGSGADGALACDRLGCVYRLRGHIVALSRSASAVVEDCRMAQVVISGTVPVRRRCVGPPLATVAADLGPGAWGVDAGPADGETGWPTGAPAGQRAGRGLPRTVIDRFSLWRNGAHAIWLVDGGGTRIETAADVAGRRPWSPTRWHPPAWRN